MTLEATAAIFKLCDSARKKLELLFEIGCEEIPAGMLARAEEELKVNLEKLLTTENLIEGITVETFSGPRRLDRMGHAAFPRSKPTSSTK